MVRYKVEYTTAVLCSKCGGYKYITKEFMKSGLFAGCACGKPNKPIEKQ